MDAHLAAVVNGICGKTEPDAREALEKINNADEGRLPKLFSFRTANRGAVGKVVFCKELGEQDRALFYLKIARFLREEDLAYFLGMEPSLETALISSMMAVAVLRHSMEAKVRKKAATMLRKENCAWPDAHFICRELGKRIADEPGVRKEVAGSLFSHGKYALPMLCELLLSGNKFTKHAALEIIMRVEMKEAKEGKVDAGALEKLQDSGFGAHVIDIRLAAGSEIEDFVNELCGHLSSKNHVTSDKACELLTAREKGRLRRGYDLDGGVLWRMSAAGFSDRADHLRKLVAQCLQRPMLIALAAKRQDAPKVVLTKPPAGKLVA